MARDPLGSPHLKLREPDQADRYVLFLSSSAEVASLRDVVEGLVDKSFNPKLSDTSPAYIRLVRWEEEVPQKAPQETVNAGFVARVRSSHLTLVLLQSQLGDGTREELEAALAEEQVQLSVLRFAGDGSKTRPDDIDTFLEPHRDKLLYGETGPPQSDRALQDIVAMLFAMALSAYERSRAKGDLHGELR